MYESSAAIDPVPVRSAGNLHELELGDPRWSAFVAGMPEATAFHDPVWAQLLSECYGHRAFVLATLDPHGEITAGLPLLETRTLRRRRRWVSLPFSDSCEPLVADPSAASALARELE